MKRKSDTIILALKAKKKKTQIVLRVFIIHNGFLRFPNNSFTQ